MAIIRNSYLREKHMSTMYLITVPHALRYITRHHLPVFNLKQVNGGSHPSPPPKLKSHSHYSRDKVRVRKVGPESEPPYLAVS